MKIASKKNLLREVLFLWEFLDHTNVIARALDRGNPLFCEALHFKRRLPRRHTCDCLADYM